MSNTSDVIDVHLCRAQLAFKPNTTVMETGSLKGNALSRAGFEPALLPFRDLRPTKYPM